MQFSVIIPLYNVEKYIRECIDSILHQTFQDYEIILIDDGSTDNSGDVCDEYAARHNNISVCHKANSGQAECRNLGVNQAAGNYVMFVDSDDYIAPDALERLHQECVVCAEPDIIMTDGMYELFPDGTISRYINWDFTLFRGLNGRDTELLSMKTGNNWSPCAKCYKTSFWRQHEFAFIPYRLAEDFELIDKIILEAEFVSMIPTFYYYRRHRKDSTVSEPNPKFNRDLLLNFYEWERYYKEKHIEGELLAEFRRTHSVSFCHCILASMYLFDKEERKMQMEKARPLLFCLDFSDDKEVRIVNRVYKIIGLAATCYLLGILKRYRIRKVRLKG